VNANTANQQQQPQPQQQQQQQRYKRCYYVPVMNPLPDLKDKQLAVLDMRLYGIRDMPTLRERAPTLPPSVLNTARLRGLPLFEVREMVEALEGSLLGGAQHEEGQAPHLRLAAAEAFAVDEEEEEEEGEEERNRLRADSKGY
jgi:hypothetical protein